MTVKWPRLTGFCAVLLTGALLATGCRDLAPDSLAYAAERTDISNETTIRMATTRSSGLSRAIEDWEREHPTAHVEVVVRNIDDHHRSIIDNAGAGGVFDIIAFDAEYGPEIRLHPDLFVNLRSLGAADFATAHLPARWAEGVAAGGELVGLPLDIDSVGLAIRSDLVDEHFVAEFSAAPTWCEFIDIGQTLSRESGIALLPDGDEFLTSVLAQNRLSFFDEDGDVLPEEIDTLKQAWNLTMLAIGAPTVDGDHCGLEAEPTGDEAMPISRNLESGEDPWKEQLRNGGFAAVLARHSELRRLTTAAPNTAGNWTLVSVPGTPSASAGGVHLGLSAASEHQLLAYDLISYLTDPAIQQAAFVHDIGLFPSAEVLYDTLTIRNYGDRFFGDSPVGAVFTTAAIERPNDLATPARRLVIDELTTALNRVENGTATSADAWAETLSRMRQILR